MKKHLWIKRTMGTLLIVGMASNIFAGCGKTNSESNIKVGEEKFSGKVVIEPCGAGHNEALYSAVNILKGMDKYKNVEFDCVPYAGEDYSIDIPLKIAGGEQVDIMYSGSPIQQQNFVDGGVIIPITEYVEKYNLDLDKTYGKYAKYGYNDDEVYGIPGAATAWGLFYNKKIFDDANVAYPDDSKPMTWDEYAQIAKKLTKNKYGLKQYGALHLSWPIYWYGEAVMALGGGEYFYKEDGRSNIKAPAFKKVLERTNKMMNIDKSIRTQTDISSSNVAGQIFLEGNYGMMACGTWALNWLEDLKKYPRDFEVGLAPMPVDEGEQQKNWGVCGTFNMTPTTKDKDLSFNVIVDLVRETTKLSSSEIYADQTVTADKLFKDIADTISKKDKQITAKQISSIFLNPNAQFVTEQISGKEANKYQDIIKEETDLYFSNEQDIDKTLNNIELRANEILTN